MNTQKEASIDRILSRSEFRALTGISRTTEFRMKQAGTLPAAVVVAGRNLGYRLSDYESWLKKNTNA